MPLGQHAGTGEGAIAKLQRLKEQKAKKRRDAKIKEEIKDRVALSTDVQIRNSEVTAAGRDEGVSAVAEPPGSLLVKNPRLQVTCRLTGQSCERNLTLKIQRRRKRRRIERRTEVVIVMIVKTRIQKMMKMIPVIGKSRTMTRSMKIS